MFWRISTGAAISIEDALKTSGFLSRRMVLSLNEMSLNKKKVMISAEYIFSYIVRYKNFTYIGPVYQQLVKH